MIDRVWIDVELAQGPVHAGLAHFSRRGSTITTSFRYSDEYLRHPGSYEIDPALPLRGGASVEGLPGSFQDCAPDRWGRNLVTKRIRAQSRQTAGPHRSITGIDFLTEVSDITRQGALRFRTSADGPHVAPDTSVPTLIELPRLLAYARTVDRDDDDDLTAVTALLDAGTGSLGGARPKAAVRDGEQLILAKFPHTSDKWDVMAWEKTALDLAARCGIPTPSARLVSVGGTHALLLNRFDRGTGSARIGYISGLTLVGGHDGGAYDYADVAAGLSDHGADVSRDLRELWRRVAFSVLIDNTDDHLRNLGLLHRPGGWTLSPAFDLNPNPEVGAARQTSIAGAIDVDDAVAGLLAFATDCRLEQRDVRNLLDELLQASSEWQHIARSNGISDGAIAGMREAFEGQRPAFEFASTTATV
ncbi:type II toxin-antitoxin system HipA family toxin [uncultured Amnibacterium sp.]|uniref:type II toxin-antitoxin system HipA family toxin n=1 Tax=uncultured Amnibacterium sp. TaxID=1631851 RepID=UPI0035CBD57E